MGPQTDDLFDKQSRSIFPTIVEGNLFHSCKYRPTALFERRRSQEEYGGLMDEVPRAVVTIRDDRIKVQDGTKIDR